MAELLEHGWSVVNLDRVPPGDLDVIANYTAFQQIRSVVGRDG